MRKAKAKGLVMGGRDVCGSCWESNEHLPKEEEGKRVQWKGVQDELQTMRGTRRCYGESTVQRNSRWVANNERNKKMQQTRVQCQGVQDELQTMRGTRRCNEKSTGQRSSGWVTNNERNQKMQRTDTIGEETETVQRSWRWVTDKEKNQKMQRTDTIGRASNKRANPTEGGRTNKEEAKSVPCQKFACAWNTCSFICNNYIFYINFACPKLQPY